MYQLQQRRGYSGARPVIKRGILTAFDPLTYTASLLIMEATSAFLQNVPVACHLDGTSARPNAFCAVLFFDEQNYSDAVVLAVYPNGSQGVPAPPPGRTVMITGFRQLNNQFIGSGVTFTLTATGVSSGIPAGTLAVLYKVIFTSPTAGAFLHIAPSGSTITDYASAGSIQPANAMQYSTGVVALDSNGQVAIQANGGNVTVTFYTYGYLF